MILALLGVGASLIFYILIPVLGAFWVRKQWRIFRKQLIQSSFSPMAEFAQFRDKTINKSHRFFGNLEAIGDDSRVWLGNGRISVSIEMKNLMVYILPDFESSDSPPLYIPWKDLHTLSEGTQFFVFGPIVLENGQGLFVSQPEQPLLVCIYEGTPEQFLRSAILTGRSRNEFWNFLTPISLAMGIACLVFLSFFSSVDGISKSVNQFLVTMALLPNTLFLPPGLLFFYLFLKAWSASKKERSLRDLSILPFRYFKESPGKKTDDMRATLPNGQTYIGLASSLVPIIPFKKGSVPLVWGTSLPGEGAWFFGALEEGPNRSRHLAPPRDPMADFVEVKGTPWQLYREHKKKARIGEFQAFFWFVLGALSNGFLIWLILQQWFP